MADQRIGVASSNVRLQSLDAEEQEENRIQAFENKCIGKMMRFLGQKL